MKISEITNEADIDLLVSITETYPDGAEHREARKNQLLTELSESGDNRHIYMATEDNIPVAMIQIVLNNADNNPELADGKEMAHLHNLWVSYDLQGNGIGYRMMEFAEAKAREMGKKVLTLGVDDTNKGAEHLYKKLNYKLFKTEEGRTPDEKCFLMKKEL